MQFRPLTPSLALVGACLASCAAVPAPPAPAPAAPFQYYGRFDATLFLDVGRRCVDTTFGPADTQLALGLEADIRQPGDDTGLEVGLFHSSDGTSEDVPGVGRVDYDAAMTEVSVGARWVYGDIGGGFRPYASLGAALLFSSYSADPTTSGSKSDSDWSVGPYFRVGLERRIDEHWSMGLDYRQVLLSDVLKDITLNGTATDANYSQFAFVLGYAF